MEIPQGFSVKEEKQATGHSVANHTTLLECTKWFFAVLHQHCHALGDLTQQQEKINTHFALSECQENRVYKEALGEVEEHWIRANKSQTEDEQTEVDKCGNK